MNCNSATQFLKIINKHMDTCCCRCKNYKINLQKLSIIFINTNIKNPLATIAFSRDPRNRREILGRFRYA